MVGVVVGGKSGLATYCLGFGWLAWSVPVLGGVLCLRWEGCRGEGVGVGIGWTLSYTHIDLGLTCLIGVYHSRRPTRLWFVVAEGPAVRNILTLFLEPRI